MTHSPIVVFDLDGTLVDTAPDLINALNYVLDREGMPPVPMHLARNMIGAGARKLIERGLERDGRDVTVADLNRLTEDFIDHYAAHIADVSRPFEGLHDALDELSAQGYRFAVCTNKLEGLSKLLLDRLELTARFDAICGADTFGVSKPDPVILQQTAARRPAPSSKLRSMSLIRFCARLAFFIASEQAQSAARATTGVRCIGAGVTPQPRITPLAKCAPRVIRVSQVWKS
eukprot:gene7624-10295_t